MFEEALGEYDTGRKRLSGSRSSSDRITSEGLRLNLCPQVKLLYVHPSMKGVNLPLPPEMEGCSVFWFRPTAFSLAPWPVDRGVFRRLTKDDIELKPNSRGCGGFTPLQI